MARVDHKKIKQLVSQKKKTITDRQLFTSRAMAAHFEDMAAAQTKRYGYRRRVKVQIVWKPKDPATARTDNNRIWINAGHPSITQYKSRQERYEQICGVFAHELGHVLYTDFLTTQTYHSRQEAGRWFPEAPPLRDKAERYAEADLWDYAQSAPQHKSILSMVSHEILNVLEDGYVEQRILTDYPGVLGSCLQVRREGDFEQLPTVSQIIEQESENGHIWLTVLQNILSYVKWGRIKYGETPLTDPRIQVVFSMLGELDQALVSTDFKDRCRTANLILVRCWPDIRDFMERCEESASTSGASTGGTSGTALGIGAEGLAKTLLSGLAGASTESSGGTDPVSSATAPPPSGAPTAKSRAATAKLAEKSAEEGKEDGDSSPAEAGTSEETEETTASTSPSTEETTENAEDTETAAEMSNEEGSENGVLADTIGSGSQSSEMGSDFHQTVSQNEEGRIELENTDEVFTPEGGGMEQDEEYAGTGYSGAASDIARVLDTMAEDSVCSELERQRTKELTELAQSISYGNIHDGVNMTVHRMAEVSDEMKEQYQEISGDLLHISKQLQKSVLQQLKDSRRGGKQTGLLMGRKLDSHTLYRRDGRVFCKNALPNEIPALSVGLLLDESGSMCSCDRATYARATAIILYDFCQALGIPVMVYGHSADLGVDLYSYAEFDAIDRNDRYRMMDISARCNNRDGAALRYVSEQLAKRPEDIKLLMLVSDGQPADIGYYGTAAEEDLRGIRQEYQRKGVLFVAAAIGSDKENIQRIYGDSFLDITDLNKLPVKLAGIIKRFIRV